MRKGVDKKSSGVWVCVCVCGICILSSSSCGICILSSSSNSSSSSVFYILVFL